MKTLTVDCCLGWARAKATNMTDSVYAEPSTTLIRKHKHIHYATCDICEFYKVMMS